MSEVLKTVMAMQKVCKYSAASVFAIVILKVCKSVLCIFIFNLGCHNRKVL